MADDYSLAIQELNKIINEKEENYQILLTTSQKIALEGSLRDRLDSRLLQVKKQARDAEESFWQEFELKRQKNVKQGWFHRNQIDQIIFWEERASHLERQWRKLLNEKISLNPRRLSL